MGRPSAGILFGFLVAVLVVQAGLLLGKGVLLIDQHEGDALHLMQISLRMGQGQWPHLDFMTPIGVLAFAPVSWLISLGVGAGKAMMGSMLMVALLMLSAIWWVGFSRLSSGLAFAFGGFLILLITALVYGGDAQVASISMYYNRWAWAVVFMLVTLVVLPAGRESEVADGLVFGFGMAFLALCKITFFAAFLPGILLGLIIRKQWTALGVGLAIGLLVAGAMTLFGGPEFWVAYIGDLRAVSGSGIRPQPGESLSYLLISPVFLAGNLCLLAGIVLLRQGGQAVEGMLLLVFAPAFIYATYQNWGNDPKWLIILGFILLSLRPDRHLNNAFGWDVGRSLGIVSLVSFALILPTIYTISLANVRHARLDRADFFQVFPGANNDDVFMRVDRMYATVRRAPFSVDNANIRQTAEAAIALPEDTLFGQPLGLCKLHMGLVGMLQQMATDLEEMDGLSGKSVFVADTFSNLWLFGKTTPVPKAAPWYYGVQPAYKNADFLLVPLCPATPAARSQILAGLPLSGVNFQEVMRNELFILLRVLPD